MGASPTQHSFLVLLLALGILVAAARLLGELAVRWRQPSVLGEIVAGILLGPTALGTALPRFSGFVFPDVGTFPLVLDGLTGLAIVLFLLVAGMEVELSTVWRQGRAALAAGLVGMVVPFALGLAAGGAAPRFLGTGPDIAPGLFALFFATALAISALPVVAKTLMDLNIYRSDIGMIVIAAAIFNDLIGWLVFALVLGSLDDTRSGSAIGMTIGLTLAFTAAMLTVARPVLHRGLAWIQAYASGPGAVLGFALSGALLSAALTEWIGIHAIFGAFLFGVALGDSPHLREHTRVMLDQFISFIFAPLFFASIGLRVNFLTHLDWGLVLFVLVVGTVGKVGGSALGARWGGLRTREALAVGCALNARGAMEIILGLLALEAGVITERLFVALVILALVTSMTGGTFLPTLLGIVRPRRFTDYLAPSSFAPTLAARTRVDAIAALARAASPAARLHPEEIVAAVHAREELESTGLGGGLAVPHARIASVRNPVAALGLSPSGVDFNAPDGQPARVILLLLTPLTDHQAQLELLVDFVRTFGNAAMVDKALRARTYTELLALVRSEHGRLREH